MKQITIISAVVLVLMLAIVMLMYASQRTKATITPFPLKKGSRGTEVEKLQQYLNAESISIEQPAIAVDGIFGNETETRLYLVTGKYEVNKIWYTNNI